MKAKLIHKISAIFGIVLLGIGSFVSCLSLVPEISYFGSALMIIAIAFSWYGFTYWRP